MIQVVLMEQRDWVLKHASFKDDEIGKVGAYVIKALNDGQTTTINITTWDDKTKERK